MTENVRHHYDTTAIVSYPNLGCSARAFLACPSPITTSTYADTDYEPEDIVDKKIQFVGTTVDIPIFARLVSPDRNRRMRLAGL